MASNCRLNLSLCRKFRRSSEESFSLSPKKPTGKYRVGKDESPGKFNLGYTIDCRYFRGIRSIIPDSPGKIEAPINLSNSVSYFSQEAAR